MSLLSNDHKNNKNLTKTENKKSVLTNNRIKK